MSSGIVQCRYCQKEWLVTRDFEWYIEGMVACTECVPGISDDVCEDREILSEEELICLHDNADKYRLKSDLRHECI